MGSTTVPLKVAKTIGKSVGDRTNQIKNKEARRDVYGRLKKEARKAKKEGQQRRRDEREKAIEEGREEDAVMLEPKTIESERVRDEASRAVTAEEMAEEELVKKIEQGREPKVLITTTRKPSAGMYAFVAELLTFFPRAVFFKRRDFEVKKIVKYAANQDFTGLIVVNEDRKIVNGLLHVNLPEGPTAYYKISNLKLAKDIRNHGRPTSHAPELILNNFSTRLGHRLAHMFASMFSPDPKFKGRRVVTFHNQRDFIFVRHHRYIFDERNAKGSGRSKTPKRVVTRLQELGPQFTLKLLSLQKGVFDSKKGEFEWTREKEGKEADKVRRKFDL